MLSNKEREHIWAEEEARAAAKKKFGHSAWDQWIKPLIEIATLTILVIGVGFAVDQATKLRDSIDEATWNSIASEQFALDKLLIEHPDMRKYFEEGATISKGDKDYDLAVSIADYYLDFFDSYYVFRPRLDPKVYELEAWENYFRETMKESPIICVTLGRSLDTYGKDVRELGYNYCNIARPNPPPEEGKS